MINGWQKRKIGDVCHLMTGGTPSKANRDYFGGDIKWLVSGDIHRHEIFDCEGRITELGMRNSNAKLLPTDSVMIALNGQGKTRGTVALLRTQATCNQSLVSIYPKNPKELLPEYICANLQGRYEELRHLTGDSGNDRRGLNMELIRQIEIPIAPVAEQQRIVGILDKSFEAIATAKANAEKNLQNARALFESHLEGVFRRRGDGWEEVELEDIASVKGGKRVPKGYRLLVDPTDFPYLRVADFTDFGSIDMDDLHYVSAEVHRKIKNYVIFSTDMYLSIAGTIGKTGIIPEELNGAHLTENACRLVFRPGVSKRFVYYFTLTSDFIEQAGFRTRTAAQPKLALSRLSTIRLGMPSLATQESLVERFDALRARTQHLESIYQQKLATLDGLRQSLLHQAFTGQLTQQSLGPVLDLVPTRTTYITPTDLHAGILAMAFEQHEKSGDPRLFTHVKAEKIAHMVEARLGLDLGRKPVKDAAGPNDFNHLKKVEYRARKAGYFDFNRVDGVAYGIQKLRGFQRLIDRTRTALGDSYENVEHLLQWMLPMNVQQAEIVATVFAAWNNLLLERERPTDEQIVFEARENWHPDKLRIERQKFFAAVQWLRQQGVVPEGKGKRVANKEN
jgi:type I restriction enzyme, S subunit